jgi:hypothetical protein
MIVAILVGGAFFGFFVDTTVINPPAQVVGVCAPPSFISGSQCLLKVCTTNQSNQQVCNYQSSGYIIGANITRGLP